MQIFSSELTYQSLNGAYISRKCFIKTFAKMEKLYLDLDISEQLGPKHVGPTELHATKF